MKLIIKYLDNDIDIKENEVYALEIENKKYFYRIVRDLHNICDNNIVEDIYLSDDNNNEINYFNKFKMFIDFFDFNLDSKKLTNDIIKYVNKNISTEVRESILTQYNKIIKLYKTELNNIDIPLIIEPETDSDNITKTLKISIEVKQHLIDNLLLLIDIEKDLWTKNVLIFVNLKQYLTRSELEELYKYSIYNGVSILLVDSQCYGGTLYNEKKLIIDENLDEFML